MPEQRVCDITACWMMDDGREELRSPCGPWCGGATTRWPHELCGLKEANASKLDRGSLIQPLASTLLEPPRSGGDVWHVSRQMHLR